MIVVFAMLLVISFVLFAIFLLRIIIQLRRREDIPSITKTIGLDKSIYERMADDSEVTEQYVYMRRKFMGG
jgi:hypothetical protein